MFVDGGVKAELLSAAAENVPEWISRKPRRTIDGR